MKFAGLLSLSLLAVLLGGSEGRRRGGSSYTFTFGTSSSYYSFSRYGLRCSSGQAALSTAVCPNCPSGYQAEYRCYNRYCGCCQITTTSCPFLSFSLVLASPLLTLSLSSGDMP